MLATAFMVPMVALGQGAQGGNAAARSDESLLEEVVISADRRKSFGADLVQAGTFRGAALIDTPLTVSVLPRELLEAQQATRLYDALRNTAGVGIRRCIKITLGPQEQEQIGQKQQDNGDSHRGGHPTFGSCSRDARMASAGYSKSSSSPAKYRS